MDSVRTLKIVLLTCLALVILGSFQQVRSIVSAPLMVHEPEARGEACYVLAGGNSIWERLDAAADLVNMGRVARIYLMQDDCRGPYSFKTGKSWTRGEWFLDYLAWRGVPPGKISLIPASDGFFGTMSEAREFAQHGPKWVRRLVLVSSAPHMRRATLAFRRALPADVRVVPYAASDFRTSSELYYPIWMEYLKLLVYYCAA